MVDVDVLIMSVRDLRASIRSGSFRAAKPPSSTSSCAKAAKLGGIGRFRQARHALCPVIDAVEAGHVHDFTRIGLVVLVPIIHMPQGEPAGFLQKTDGRGKDDRHG